MRNRLKCSLNRISSSIILSILLVEIISSIPSSSLNAQTTTNNSNPVLNTKEGVSSGDVTHNSAVIWSRANNDSLMHVIYDNNSAFSDPNLRIKAVNNSTDYAGKIKIDELHSNTKYFYDGDAVLEGELEHAAAPLRGQHRPGRVLERRDQVDQLRPVACQRLFQRIDSHAVVVDR